MLRANLTRNAQQDRYMVFVDECDEEGVILQSKEVGYLVTKDEAVNILASLDFNHKEIGYAFSTCEDH